MDFDQMTAPIAEAGERDPREYPLGFYMHDVYPNPQLGRFQWYASVSDLLDAICVNMPAIHCDPGDGESGYEEMVAALNAERATAGGEEALTVDLRSRMAKHFEGNSEILWWGTFAELCATDDAWVRELREQHREDRESDEPHDRPVEKRELEGWIEFIAGYGY